MSAEEDERTGRNLGSVLGLLRDCVKERRVILRCASICGRTKREGSAKKGRLQ